MPVLKQHNSTPAMREAIVLDLGDIGAQAARIRAAAESQAQQIIAKAQAKAEQTAHQRGEEAEQRGYADGLEKGLAEGREQGRTDALQEAAGQLAQIAAAWSQVANDWEQQRTEMEREARQAVLDFALGAAEKLVHRVIEVDESVIVDQAAQALSLVLSASDASVLIHPVDRPMLEDALPQLVSELSNLQHIELVDDEQITPGGCVVAFGQGRVDATIERQMQRLIDLIVPEPPVIEDDPEEPYAADTNARAAEQADADDDGIAPVYEVTEQGLIESGALKPAPKDHQPTDPYEGLDDVEGDVASDADDENESGA